MAVNWTTVESAIEDSIDAQATTKITAACEALKAALDAFVAAFTGTPDDDYAQVATFLSNLATATTTNTSMLTASQIKDQIPSTMASWVTTALEDLVEATLPGSAQTAVTGEHIEYLPHQP